MRRGGLRPLFLFLLVGVIASFSVPLSDTHAVLNKNDIKQVVEVLEASPHGRLLLSRARAQWGFNSSSQIKEVVKWGDVSKTDAVLIRHLDPRTGKETQERNVIVYLRKGQNVFDTVLDLAHELEHATAKPQWDPYDPDLTADKYIKLSIEGDGGEVDAVISECMVSNQLVQKYRFQSLRCLKYQNHGRLGLNRGQVLKDFYKIGKWKSHFQERMGTSSQGFPHLSGRSPQLYSSTGQSPYPISLLDEFDLITKAACNNSRRRLASLGAHPARVSTSKFLIRRCAQN